MRQTPFVWLGSGRSRKHDVAYKGKMLDLAARGGLPVPQGGILLDEFFRICLDEKVVELIGDRVIVPDPVWLLQVLYRDIRFPQLKTRVAVRLATAVSEEQWQKDTHAQLNIDFEDAQQLAKSLRFVWSVRDPRNEENQMDVLVMSMVDAQTRGIASSIRSENQDATSYFEAGNLEQGQPLNLPRLRLFGRSQADLPPFARRLQKLLGGVRRTFGRGDYQIEWADDGEICWLIQVL